MMADCRKDPQHQRKTRSTSSSERLDKTPIRDLLQLVARKVVKRLQKEQKDSQSAR